MHNKSKQPDETQRIRRTVRSFVRREGRITVAQRRALERLWPRWGIDYDTRPLDLDTVFGRQAPRYVEIGFGNGDLLATLAGQHPERDFLGIEVYRPGIGRLLQRLERDGLDNVRIVCHDAVEVLRDQIADAALDGVQIFFPDPWPKKRHHKRRLIQPPFVALLARKLRRGGELHIATDWPPYAEHIEAVLSASGEFALTEHTDAADRRGSTRFERRGRRLGHTVHDLLARRR